MILEILIIMIGIPWLIYRFVKEWKASEDASRRNSERRIREREYKKYILKYNSEAGDKVWDWIDSGEHCDEIENEFGHYFSRVLGDDWKEESRLNSKFPKGTREYPSEDNKKRLSSKQTREWVYYLLLAKMGMVDSSWEYTSDVKFGKHSYEEFDSDIGLDILETVQDEFIKNGHTHFHLVKCRAIYLSNGLSIAELLSKEELENSTPIHNIVRYRDRETTRQNRENDTINANKANEMLSRIEDSYRNK